METLDTFELSLQELLRRYAALAEENRLLREANDNQRGEILRTHSELLALQTECARLKTANALAGDPETRKKAYERLTQIIKRVDTAIEVLKQ
ncbi:MAG: hypothetical protein ACI30A_03915 [Paludibacteraceae bacterium]